MPVSSDPITPTSRIGRYELLREIGRGGMAVLYEARHVHLDMRVAVKRPLASHTGGDVAQARFRNEALYAARIRHPNVIRIHDYDVEDGAPYIAMDLIEGSPLSAILAAHGPLPLHRVVDLLLAILSGISAVHAAGITHRDLKPHNLLIGRDASAREHPIIIDFGVAKSIFDADEPGAVGLTTSGSTLGTAGYMAPEQILSARDAGPLADQYSLAVTLYECLTGATPFYGASAYETMHAALNARPHAPSALRPGLPPQLDEVLLQALRRAPAERFPSVHAMGNALLPFASEDATLAWEADARRARPPEIDGLAPASTHSTLPEHARDARRFSSIGRLASTALVSATLGAVAASLVASQRAPAHVALAPAVGRPPTTTVVCPTLSASAAEEPLAAPVSVPSVEAAGVVPSSSASALPSDKAAHRAAKRDEHAARVTNGAPILE